MIRFKILDSTVHMRVSGASTSSGKDGGTPHIGDNGNWYLGDVDTGNPSRGETGPAGYTPVRGTDYWTEADQNAIVSQAVTQIQPDISELKSDLSDLAPAGAAVGQLFRVAAISEDGKYTMEPVDMLDVRVNGESIVQDGVANIPTADVDLYGVLKIGNANQSGLSIYNNRLVVESCATSQITNRSTSVRPIVPNNLDIAVKAAMCDGKGAAWTADEQAAARERMGIHGQPGADGRSLEFVWDGTRLGVRVQGESTYQYAELKGADGAPGADGADGADGKSLEFNWSGTQLGVRVAGTSNYTYVDLKGATGEPGADGAPGAPGADGYTPQRGVDYWTAADQAQIVQDVLAALPNASGVSF